MLIPSAPSYLGSYLTVILSTFITLMNQNSGVHRGEYKIIIRVKTLGSKKQNIKKIYRRHKC